MNLMESETCCESPKLLNHPPTLRQGLESQKRHLETRLQKVNEGLAALDKNPELSELLEKVQLAIRA